MFGDAIPRSASSRLTAKELAARWERTPHEAFDGFHAAISIHDRTILIGGDLFGLFPLYYAAHGDVLIAGSSYTLFSHHPLFPHQPDVEGLLGHLLIAGPFSGRTLSGGVRRLSPGARLHWSAGSVPREDTIYSLPDESDNCAIDRATAASRLGASLEHAVRRHTASYRELSLQLSGGRDSRLLAGYLTRSGRSARAVTLGRSTDFEVDFAARVAAQLALPHHVHEIPFSDFSSFADQSVQWEQLAAGMSSVHTWGNGAAFGNSDGVLAGYLLEVRHVDLGGPACDDVLRRTHAHGLAPDRLAALLSTDELRTAMWDVLAQMRNAYEHTASSANDRRCRWLLHTYMRFHAGSVPWRLSFSAWPVLPVLDQELLETTFALHEPWLIDRKLQELLLCNEFPALARLPLDRNSPDTQPLIEAPHVRLGRAALQRLTGGRYRVQRRTITGIERRYYWRMYNFDNAGWREIRHAAEPGRLSLTDLFDPTELRSLVPDPNASCAHTEPVAEGYAPKLLTGLMRWHVLRS